MNTQGTERIMFYDESQKKFMVDVVTVEDARDAGPSNGLTEAPSDGGASDEQQDQ
jgi:hypothetical protein